MILNLTTISVVMIMNNEIQKLMFIFNPILLLCDILLFHYLKNYFKINLLLSILFPIRKNSLFWSLIT